MLLFKLHVKHSKSHNCITYSVKKLLYQVLLFNFIFWKGKTYQLQLWFLSKQIYLLIPCKQCNYIYFIVDLSGWIIKYQKIPVFLLQGKKILASFTDPKKSLLSEILAQKNLWTLQLLLHWWTILMQTTSLHGLEA